MNILSFEYLFPLPNTPRTFFIISQCCFKLAFFLNLTMKLLCWCWPNDLEFSQILLNLFKIEMLQWSEREQSMIRMFNTQKRLEILGKKQGVLTDLSKLVSHFCT